MPAVITARFAAPPGSQEHVSLVDVHRLGCYLLEPPSSRAHQQQVKPFAVWPPLRAGSGVNELDEALQQSLGIPADADLIDVRLNWLPMDPPPLDQLEQRLAGTPHLGAKVPLRPLGLSVEEHSYPAWASGEPARRCTIDVLTPLVFSRNGRQYPLPDPVLAVRRLAERWDGFVASVPGLGLDAAVVRDLCSTVVIEEFDLSTQTVDAPTPQVGCVGRVVIGLRGRRNRTVDATFGALWRFASLAGVGRGTTHGLGAVDVELSG